MANRWTRKAAEPHTITMTTDPVSRKLSQAVQDLRNGTLAKQLSGGDADDVTIQAIFKPIVATMAEQIMAQMKQGQTPQQEDVNAIMTEHLKRRLLQKQIEDLDRGNDRNRESAPKDVMAFAEGAVNIQKAAADTAMAGQDRERQLRLEAEQNAGEAAAYARQEEQQKASQTIDIIREMNTAQTAMLEKMHATEMAFKDYQMNTTVESIRKATEEAIAQITKASQDAAALKDQLHEKDLKLLDLQHQTTLAKNQASLPLNQDPQYLWSMLHINNQAAQLEQQRTQDGEKHASLMETHAMIRKQMPDVVKLLGNVFAGGFSVDNPLAGQGAPPPPDAPGIGGLANS